MKKRNIEKEHSAMVRRLKKDPEFVMKGIGINEADAIHMALGIAGEAGELVDAIKKWVIYGKLPDIENILEELGDLEFFMEGMRNIIGVSRQFVLDGNIEKLTKRYGQQYSDRAAIERKDKS